MRSTQIFGTGGTGVPDDLNWLTTIAFATHAAARAGDRALCAMLVQELLPYRDQFVDNASTFFGSVERYLGLALSALDRHDEAQTSFERGSRPTIASTRRSCWHEHVSNGARPFSAVIAIRRPSTWRGLSWTMRSPSPIASTSGRSPEGPARRWPTSAPSSLTRSVAGNT